MIDWLYEIGDFWVFVIFGLVSVVCFMVAPYIGTRLHLTAPSKDRADYVIRAQATVISFTAIILAFSLVQVQGNLRRAEEIVAKEAGQLDFLDRQLLRYGDPKVADLRSLLWDYTNAILQDEWRDLQYGIPSERTEQARRPLSQAVFQIEPQTPRQTAIYNEILKSIDQLAESRDERIAAAQLHLPFEFWCLAFALFMIMVALSLMLEPASHQNVSIAAQGLAIAFLAALVFVIDYPFKGSFTVEPAAIEHALKTMRARV
jgi:hypothetical protein